LGQFSKNYRTLNPKIVTKLSKIRVWDPGSGKNLFRIPDPGVKKAPDPGSATLLAGIMVTPFHKDLISQKVPSLNFPPITAP